MGRVNNYDFNLFKVILLAVILAGIFTCYAVSAESLRVGSSDENFTSIQAAVDAAEPEDTIFVSPGTYVENLKIDKHVRVWSVSRNPEDTIISSADPYKNTVEISANSVSFSGFGIENSKKTGILLAGVKNCFINNNKARGEEYGIFLKNSEGNTISDNILVLNEKGIRFEGSNSNDIQDNIIAYNYGPGISLEESRKNIIYNNYFKNAENIEEKDVNAENIWQSPLVTKQNIVKGPYIAGNFWADLEEKGYSETCTDENSNGICDTFYNVTGGGTDKFPLFPKVPNAVKTIENKLNDSASAYEKEIINRETATETGKETNGTNESSGKNATGESPSEEEASWPGLEIVTIALGLACFLRQNR